MKKFQIIYFYTMIIFVSFTFGDDYKPESVGLSSERLKKIDALIDARIEEKKIAGAVVLVARKGKIAYFHAAGLADSDKPMKKDTIFRVVSMTKPVTSVAIMKLYEEGKLLLSDPVSKYIPEFKNPKVIVPQPVGSKSPYILVPAKREVTIRDLLSHSSGILYMFPANYYHDKKREMLVDLYKEADVSDGFCRPDEEIGDMVKRLARLPLYENPGEVWEYGLNSDILAYLVEVISGMKYDKFVDTYIFKPLKMKDSYFYVPKEKQERIAAVWISDWKGSLERAGDKPLISDNLALCPSDAYQTSGKYFSGGGSLLSTVYDYYRFSQMLLNGGDLEGVRVLSRKTVELMTATNHIGDFDAIFLHSNGWKFGLGFAIQQDRGHDVDSGDSGTFEWAGLYSTRFSIDPKEEKITIFMSQTTPFDGHFELWDRLLVLSGSAIDD
jgi:CubicO group peptidase (beta-lactamase class C family)